jgi:cystathionine beta-synthase
MFDFGRIDEVVTDPRRFGSDLKGKKRKFIQITMDTPLTALSRFLEWNSAAVVTEPGEEGSSKPLAVVTKVDLLSYMVKQKS